jgi:hypothetical protein
MAVKIILLSIILGIILLLTLDALPGNEAYNTCLMQMKANYSTITNHARGRNWNQEDKCKATYKQITLDQQCIETVKENYLTARYIFWLSQYRPQINSVIRNHNQYCYDYKISLYEIDVEKQ